MKKRNYITGGAFLAAASLHGQVLINEVDADTPGTDALEFVELYDGGAGSTSLNGLVLVFFNGGGDTSYAAYDLDGQTTDANGFFVIGSVTGADLAFNGATNQLQNGADAVALYTGDDTDFPNGTAVTATNLIDAVVYDTNDGDDSGLLTVLTPGQAQIDEAGGGDKDNDSIARKPDGGIALNTTTYIAGPSTPGATNGAPADPITISLDATSIAESSLGMITATFSRTGTTGDLDISVSLDDASEAVEGSSTVTIPDTLTSITVDIFPVDDLYPDGDQVVTLTATPSGGVAVTETFNVTDDVSDAYSLVINEVYSIPQEDLNGDSSVTNNDEFIEIVNVTGSSIDLSFYTVEDAFSFVHEFREGTILEAGCAIIVGSGGFDIGASAGVFGTAEVQNASDGTTLRISDGGDTMKLFNDVGDEVYTVDVPDLTATAAQGSYVLATDGDPTSGYIRQSAINLAFSSPGVDGAGADFCTTTAAVTAVASVTTVAEDAGASAVTVTVSIPSALGVDLEVFLYSSDPSEIEVPFGDPIAVATITAGNTSTTPIDMDVVDDVFVDGTQVVNLIAGASGYLNGSDSVDVTDAGDVPTFTGLVINEVDADTPASGDDGELVELYETAGTGGNLDGLVLVLFNGSNDQVYDAVDLSGNSITANGFFLIGDNGVIDTNDGIQNGADAVALYVGSLADFPDGTAIGTITNTLIDAVVYDTSDSDDAGLLAALTPGSPQVNEGSSQNTDSNSRVPDGGAAFDTSVYVAQAPTPNATNVIAMGGDIVATAITRSGTTATITFTSSGNVDVYKTTDLQDFTSLGSPYATDQTSPYADASATEAAAYYILVPTGDPAP